MPEEPKCRDAPDPPVVNAARRLVERVTPKRAKHFIIEPISADRGRDVFNVASRAGKVVLQGNTAVSIASALNWYLQNQCHVNISWHCGSQLNLSQRLPLVRKTVRIVSPHKYRYAYNFCTYGYTMAWWHWPQWERELDSLALHGINLALVIVGQESVWLKTFANFGYSAADIHDWVPDPAHLPWFEMGNMESYGGPLWRPLIAQRLGLAQKIVARMHQLGIQPVLPGYYGIVPPDFHQRFPKTDVRRQGEWLGLKRPDLLNPADPMFPKVAAAYYAAQRKMLGCAQFYDADPFHEGGDTKGMDIPATGRAISDAMGGATWVLQSWRDNPPREMVGGLGKNKLLVLDLYCEEIENWRLRDNFDGAPWLWCAINCFGGNVTLGGRLAWMAAGPNHARTNPAKGHLAGIGAPPEGAGVNPILWEMLFDGAWRTETPNLDAWLESYLWCRYGAKIPAAQQAWKILADSVYKINVPPPWIAVPAVCSRPSLNSTGFQPYYTPSNTAEMLKAWELLLEAAPAAKSFDGFRFDLCDVSRQVLTGLGELYNSEIIAAFQAGDAARLRKISVKMLALIHDLDKLTGTRHEWLLGVWLADARSWGMTTAQKALCERNARELLTTWTCYDNITDYANRQWSGLFSHFYYRRWQMWLQSLSHSMSRGVPLDEPKVREGIRRWELQWTRQTNGRFATKPHGDVIIVSRALCRKYTTEVFSTCRTVK